MAQLEVGGIRLDLGMNEFYVLKKVLTNAVNFGGLTIEEEALADSLLRLMESGTER